MKRIKLYSIICAFMLISLSVKSQTKTPEYVVYQNIGKCAKLISSKNIVLKKGDFLSSTEILNIPSGGKLIVICANFKPIQLNVKGKYAVKTLAKECGKTNGSFTAKYFHFVWDELTHKHTSPEAEPEKYMKTAGAVTRGNDPVNLALNADTLNYFNGTLNINFLPKSETVTVKFLTASNPKNVFITQKSTGFLSFTEFAKSKQVPGIYYWQITASNYKKGGLHVLNLMDEQAYNGKIKSIIASVINYDKAESAFMTAFLLEQNHFLVEAQKYYKKAIILKPKNKTYQSFNARFYGE